MLCKIYEYTKFINQNINSAIRHLYHHKEIIRRFKKTETYNLQIREFFQVSADVKTRNWKRNFASTENCKKNEVVIRNQTLVTIFHPPFRPHFSLSYFFYFIPQSGKKFHAYMCAYEGMSYTSSHKWCISKCKISLSERKIIYHFKKIIY